MPQSELGYYVRVPDLDGAVADDAADVWSWRHVLANNAAHLLDTRGQPIASWIVEKNGTPLSNDSSKLSAPTRFSWMETIGPFSLPVLASGRPAPVRVLVSISTSVSGRGVTLHAVLRPSSTAVQQPADGGLVRAGWNYATATTTVANAAWTELSGQGYLQLPRDQWLTRQSRGGLSSTNNPQYDPADSAECCIDMFGSWNTLAADTQLSGYEVYTTTYGEKTDVGVIP